MLLVLDTEVNPDYRYLAPEIQRLLPDADYHIYPADPIEEIPTKYDGVVLSGSTASVYNSNDHHWMTTQVDLISTLRDQELPLLGICFGHQLVNHAFGGAVEQDRRRATFVTMEIVDNHGILDNVAPLVPVLHADVVTDPGDDMVVTARTAYNDVFCTRHASAPIWTVQFHPEFTDRVADIPTDWDPGSHTFADSTATTVLTNFAKRATNH